MLENAVKMQQNSHILTMPRGSFAKIYYGAKVYAEVGVREWGIAALVVLIAVTCFGLGRLSVLVERTPITVTQVASVAKSIAPGGMFVASKTGEVYYYPWCGGAQNIATDQQVWFKSEEAAQKAGYRPAKNCKGL
jgi:hypothetical protein